MEFTDGLRALNINLSLSKIQDIVAVMDKGALSQTYGGILTATLHTNDVPCCWTGRPRRQH